MWVSIEGEGGVVWGMYSSVLGTPTCLVIRKFDSGVGFYLHPHTYPHDARTRTTTIGTNLNS